MPRLRSAQAAAGSSDLVMFTKHGPATWQAKNIVIERQMARSFAERADTLRR